MEGFLSTVPPYNGCGNPVCGPGKAEGRFATPQSLNYLELCKAILSQVHAGMPAAPRRAVTRECGVQVNAKVDKIVQCSLGPKTLSVCADGDRADSSRRSPDAVKRGGRSPQNTPPVSSSSSSSGGGLRFVRPVSVYSPVFDRRLPPRKFPDGGASEEEEEDEDEEDESRAEESERDAEDDADHDLKSTFHRSYKSANFQFLEQRYGFFHCKKCNIRWESAYVWCISGTSKVYYKQLCRKCQVGFNPYRVESILCKGCSQTCCSCEKKQRHINMKRPHRQDLCCRCKGMRLSCDATYSFKYIL